MLLVVVIVVLMAAAVVGVAIHHPGRTSATGPKIPTAGATTTAPPPNGMMVLSEPVDMLTVAVPAGWTVLPTSPTVLPAMLRQLAAQNTQLASLLKGEAIAANEGAVRLFAYTSSPLMTYAAIISYAAPASTAITADMGAAFSKYDKQSADAITDITVVPTPAGPGLRLRAAAFQPSSHVAYENLALINSGRAVVLQVAADVSSLSFPPVFSQIESTIHIG